VADLHGGGGFYVPGLLLAVMIASVLWMCYTNGLQLPRGVPLTFGINAFFVIAGAALLLKHRSASVLITLGASVFVVRTLLGSSGTSDYWSMASYAIAVGVAWWARGNGLLRSGSNNSPKPTPLRGKA